MIIRKYCIPVQRILFLSLRLQGVLKCSFISTTYTIAITSCVSQSFLRSISAWEGRDALQQRNFDTNDRNRDFARLLAFKSILTATVV